MLQKLSALLILIASLASGMSGSIHSNVLAASDSALVLPVELTETPIDPTSTLVSSISSTPFEIPLATSTEVPTETLTATPTMTPTPTPASTATPNTVRTPPSFTKSNPPVTKTPDVWTLACIEANRLLIKTLARLFFLNQDEIIKWFCMSYRYSEIQPPGAVVVNLVSSGFTNPGKLPVLSMSKLQKKPAILGSAGPDMPECSVCTNGKGYYVEFRPSIIRSGMPPFALEQSQKAVEEFRVLNNPSYSAASNWGTHFEASFPGKVQDAGP